MNSIEHLSFWARCIQCGYWGWDIYMSYATLQPQAYVCLFCAAGRDQQESEPTNAPTHELRMATPANPDDMLCSCD